ncbi:hypothetical protein AAG570_012025 [Ranatra chinensis]|uniref:RRM domain-containing protein n=1 Tax=Ranatra chinensis TaxID=642074 RepID=A0ABD0Z5X2_9HEMI
MTCSRSNASPIVDENSMKMSKVGNQTNSQDPQAVNSRVFVGNLNTFQCSKTDVERMFQRYGRLAVCIHDPLAPSLPRDLLRLGGPTQPGSVVPIPGLMASELLISVEDSKDSEDIFFRPFSIENNMFRGLDAVLHEYSYRNMFYENKKQETTGIDKPSMRRGGPTIVSYRSVCLGFYSQRIDFERRASNEYG